MSEVPGIPPEPPIIKKIVVGDHGGHHGGAWKVAYADFVTAMMAFFLLMWIIGATNEDQRKGIADYFAPTLISMPNSGGSNGVLGGRSLEAPDGVAPHAKRAGAEPVAPFAASEAGRAADDAHAKRLAAELQRRLERDPRLRGLAQQVRFVATPEGLRIELIDGADFAMFTLGTALLDPRATQLLRTVADVIGPTGPPLAIRGHTDGLPFASGRGNNWTLSSARAEAARQALAAAGVSASRFRRLEGVADTDPFNAADPADPRNRRLSITLLGG